jgi:hypothetical protein
MISITHTRMGDDIDMDKTIIKVVVAMTVMVAYPSYAIDYEYCSKLLEQRGDIVDKLAKSVTEEYFYIKVPPTVCKEEKIEEEVYKCESKWQKMYLANTQKPKGSVFKDGSMLFYSTKSKYWNKKLIDIRTQQKNNECP